MTSTPAQPQAMPQSPDRLVPDPAASAGAAPAAPVPTGDGLIPAVIETGNDAVAVPRPDAELPGWMLQTCEVVEDGMGWDIPPAHCEALALGVVASIIGAVIFALAGALLILTRKLIARSVGKLVAPMRRRDGFHPLPTHSAETLQRAWRVLTELPPWQHARSRRQLVEMAIGKGHPALAEIVWDGSPAAVAREVVAACHDQHGDGGAEAPLCRLLAGLPTGANARRDAEIDALRRALGCG